MANKSGEAFVGSEVPAFGAFAVTPHDSNTLQTNTRALWVGGAGNIVVRMLDGNTVTFIAVNAGQLLPIQVDLVKSTLTTATSIVGLY